MTRTTIPTAPLTAVTPLTIIHSKAPRLVVSDLVPRSPCHYTKIRLADSIHIKDFERSSTPTSDDEPTRNDPPAFVSPPRDLSDEDEDYVQQRRPQKKGGYDSRIEQILYENEDLQILITDAGKSHESGGSYIAYTIRTGVC